MGELDKVEDMIELHDETMEKILAALMDKNNIEMKTEIQMPLNLTRLNAIADALIAHQRPKSGKLLKDFIKAYLEYMVSHDREGRKEIIHAISESLKKEKTIGEKLTSPPS